jgi:hypothetical protein
VLIVSGLREEAGGASTGEAREVARKAADANRSANIVGTPGDNLTVA